jgi:hypothetical protein
VRIAQLEAVVRPGFDFGDGIGVGEVEEIHDALVNTAEGEGAALAGDFGIEKDEEAEACAVHVRKGIAC